MSVSASGSPLGDPSHLEAALRGRLDILFYEGFARTDWVASFAPEWGPRPAEHGAVVPAPAAPSGHALRVRYPQGEIGGPSGYQFFCRFPGMGLQPRNEAWLRYDVRFDPGFDFVKGGKLPGLGGGEANTGGHPSDGRDGWTARIMWRPGGRVVQYVYHVGQKGIYGDDLDWTLDGEAVHFTPGRWARVETHVKLNDPGLSNGVIQSWFNGRLALDVRDFRFRSVEDLKLDVFYFSTFFGGAQQDWAPPKDEHAEFTGFVIASSRIN